MESYQHFCPKQVPREGLWRKGGTSTAKLNSGAIRRCDPCYLGQSAWQEEMGVRLQRPRSRGRWLAELGRDEKRAYRTAVSSGNVEGHGDQAIDPGHDVAQHKVFHNQNVSP